MSGVRAHIGGPAAEGAEAMGATAYAANGAVAFAGAPDLHTAAHEAAHVVQQSSGVQLKGGVGEAGDPYERHADAVADHVVRGESAESLLDQHAGPGAAPGVVQRRDYNGPYPGNRLNPATSTGAGYAIRSSASRVMHTGDSVEYSIERPQGGGDVGVRWQVINDPTATGVAPTVDGPPDQLRWRLYARVAGVHTIKAWITQGGQQVAELSYQQQVVASSGFVQVPAKTVTSASTSTTSTIMRVDALAEALDVAAGPLPRRKRDIARLEVLAMSQMPPS